MTAAIKAEFRKLLSTRLWWILLIVMIAYLVFIAGVMSFSLTLSLPADSGSVLSGPDTALTVYSLTNAIGYVFPLILGSLMFTAEFRHKTITESLLVEPRRGILLGSKLIVGALFGLVIGVVATASTVATAAPVLAWRGEGSFLGHGDVQAVIVFSVLVMAIWTVFGAALGGLITNQVAAIVVILAFTQFVEPIARLALGAVDALARVSEFLPGAAADAVMGASFYSQMGSESLLGRGQGIAVLAVYILVLAAGARLITLRHDVG